MKIYRTRQPIGLIFFLATCFSATTFSAVTFSATVPPEQKPSPEQKTAPEQKTVSPEQKEVKGGYKSGEPMILDGESWITQDGVHLSATYYPGAAGRNSIPVVLLHGKNGSRNDFNEIIPELTKKGMAVLVPDLRGHGKSTTRTVIEYQNANAATPSPPQEGDGAFLPADDSGFYQRRPRRSPSGQQREQMIPITKDVEYKVGDFTDDDYLAMAEYDLALLRAFLVFENNNERLNLNKLSLVGIEMGASLAVVWAERDWGKRPPVRQLKTVTLVSPVANQVTGLFAGKALREGVAFMIVVGQNSSEYLEGAKKIRSEILGGKEDTEQGIRSKCPLILCNTEKQGSPLFQLDKPNPNLRAGIPLFIEDRINKLDGKETKWVRIKE